ncbi:hypothetical protein BJ912DRAFT_1042637 [Pholiota molesta]|nr:hypothetical protein BJ912DRAFT_1042637 [Pholiota molesta]
MRLQLTDKHVHRLSGWVCKGMELLSEKRVQCFLLTRQTLSKLWRPTGSDDSEFGWRTCRVQGNNSGTFLVHTSIAATIANPMKGSSKPTPLPSSHLLVHPKSMPETHKGPYAASVNPPRRAKRAAPPSSAQEAPQSSTSVAPRPIMPMKPYTPRATTTASDPAEPPPPPAKRGRKPGPLSRTAREAQRRLNHSIIEKARRTKINDALAALKQLVPVNYGQQQPTDSAAGSREQRNGDEDDEDDNDEDGDYEDGGPVKKSKNSSTTTAPKPKGKKEEKEKEFKLEILIRTVSFLQDLLKRVATLEDGAATTAIKAVPACLPSPQESRPPTCPTCNGRLEKARRQHQTKKRKRALSPSDDPYTTDNDDNDERDTPRERSPASSLRPAKIPRRSHNTNANAPHAPISSPANTGSPSIPSAPVPLSVPVPTAQSHVDRLPSISSWLHPLDPIIDPQLLAASSSVGGNSSGAPGAGTSDKGGPGPGSNAYLPSPPASAHFVPVRNAHGQPPLLSLGPVATAAMVSNGANVGTSTSTSSAASAGGRAHAANRTAEDESAASLLLQIAASPTFRAVRSSSFSSASSAASVSASMPAPDAAASTARRSPISPALSYRSRAESGGGGNATSPGGWALQDPSQFTLHSGVRGRPGPERGGEREREWGSEKEQAELHQHQHQQQVQTPSSLLGLNLGLGGAGLLAEGGSDCVLGIFSHHY